MVAIENDITPTKNYNLFLFSTSYGAFSAQHNKCTYALISSNKATLTMTCSNGKVNGSVVTSGVPAVLSD